MTSRQLKTSITEPSSITFVLQVDIACSICHNRSLTLQTSRLPDPVQTSRIQRASCDLKSSSVIRWQSRPVCLTTGAVPCRSQRRSSSSSCMSQLAIDRLDALAAVPTETTVPIQPFFGWQNLHSSPGVSSIRFIPAEYSQAMLTAGEELSLPSE